MSAGLLLPRTNDARRAAYAAGKKIQCLVDKLLTDLSEMAIDSCENAQARERICKVLTRGPKNHQTPCSWPKTSSEQQVSLESLSNVEDFGRTLKNLQGFEPCK